MKEFCPKCKGTGYIPISKAGEPPRLFDWKLADCYECYGTGYKREVKFDGSSIKDTKK